MNSHGLLEEEMQRDDVRAHFEGLLPETGQLLLQDFDIGFGLERKMVRREGRHPPVRL